MKLTKAWRIVWKDGEIGFAFDDADKLGYSESSLNASGEVLSFQRVLIIDPKEYRVVKREKQRGKRGGRGWKPAQILA